MQIEWLLINRVLIKRPSDNKQLTLLFYCKFTIKDLCKYILSTVIIITSRQH